jgi:hypothetical protein
VKESTAAEDRNLSLADLHCHTVYSDGLSTPERMAQEARLRGLQILAITDHLNSGEDVSNPKYQHYFEECSRIEIERLLIIPGVEVSSLDGDLVCLLPSFRISRDIFPIAGGKLAEETIELVHGAGGIALAAHPFRKKGVGEKLAKLEFDGMEIGSPVSGEYAKQRGLALVGSSDAHTRLGVGASYTCLNEGSLEPGKASIDRVLEALQRRQSFARTLENGNVLRRMDKARWLRPDYVATALFRRMTSQKV